MILHSNAAPSNTDVECCPGAKVTRPARTGTRANKKCTKKLKIFREQKCYRLGIHWNGRAAN